MDEENLYNYKSYRRSNRKRALKHGGKQRPRRPEYGPGKNREGQDMAAVLFMEEHGWIPSNAELRDYYGDLTKGHSSSIEDHYVFDHGAAKGARNKRESLEKSIKEGRVPIEAMHKALVGDRIEITLRVLPGIGKTGSAYICTGVFLERAS